MIDVTTIQELLVSMSWLTPLAIGLVAVVRASLALADRWVPLASVIVGVVLGGLAVGITPTGALVGIVIGLSASGLYDVGKKTILGA